MDLVTLRQKAAELSGRYDLVVDTTDWADNGMDFFINNAVRFLDRMSDTPKSVSRIFEELAANAWYFEFTLCREIHSVWINNTEGRSQLTRKDYPDLLEDYSGLISETDSGTPLYYCPNSLRNQDDTDIDTLGVFFNRVLDDSQAYRGIIILPPPDESIVVEVKGLFYSAVLSNDSDENYWTLMHPDLLIMATLYEIEIFNRNSEGMRDWLGALNVKIDSIRKDLISEEVFDVNQMEG